MNDDVLFDLKQSSGSDSEDSAALPTYVKTIQDQEEKKQVIEEE